MLLQTPAFLKQLIDPYATEVRARADQFHADGTSWADRIYRQLCNIERAIKDQDWTPGHQKFNETYADLTQVWPDAIARVPMGTEWILETWNAIMPAGTATIVVRANNNYRWSASVTTTGIGTFGAFMARGMHFQAGDEITVETIGMTAGETMQVYLQFKTRPIRSRPAVFAGRQDVAADRMTDANTDDSLDRHSTPSVFQGTSVRGNDTVRPPHIPPALPVVR